MPTPSWLKSDPSWRAADMLPRLLCPGCAELACGIEGAGDAYDVPR